jgi:hypothetical protein
MKIFNKLIIYYFSFIAICILLAYVYFAYTNLSINIFLYLLISIIISYFILFYLKKKTIFKNKYLNKFLNINYIFIIQRMLIIKFLLLYIYLTTDYIYCGSDPVKMLHNTFVGIGQRVDVAPETTVSILKCIGVCTLIVGTTYCTFKAYDACHQIYYKKSLNDRFNQLTNKVSNMELEISELQYKVFLANHKNESIFSYINLNKLELKIIDSNLENQQEIKNLIFREVVDQQLMINTLTKKQIRDLQFLKIEFLTLSIIKSKSDKELTIRGFIPVNDMVNMDNQVADSLVGKSYKIAKASNTRLLLENLEADIPLLFVSLTNHLTFRILRGIDVQVFCKVIMTYISNLLNKRLTIDAFIDFLRVLGLDQDCIQYLNKGLTLIEILKKVVSDLSTFFF